MPWHALASRLQRGRQDPGIPDGAFQVVHKPASQYRSLRLPAAQFTCTAHFPLCGEPQNQIVGRQRLGWIIAFHSRLDRRRLHQIVDDTRVRFGSFFCETARSHKFQPDTGGSWAMPPLPQARAGTARYHRARSRVAFDTLTVTKTGHSGLPVAPSAAPTTVTSQKIVGNQYFVVLEFEDHSRPPRSQLLRTSPVQFPDRLRPPTSAIRLER